MPSLFFPMDETNMKDDLRALYRYLRTVPPAEGGPDPVRRDPVVATR